MPSWPACRRVRAVLGWLCWGRGECWGGSARELAVPLRARIPSLHCFVSPTFRTLIRLPAAEYGLYGAFVPCIAYALLGSSRQLAVGPVAVTSIMLANGLSNIFPEEEVRAHGVLWLQAPRAARRVMPKSVDGPRMVGGCDEVWCASWTARLGSCASLCAQLRITPCSPPLQLAKNPDLQESYNHAAVQVGRECWIKGELPLPPCALVSPY